ncbi:TadE/TadG family type IV pilus assembly protein [Candidatus Liberibacter sp.]|uniref:TadE/TadG family type IV pilus assembly protein n=1 Tax=Candidatus Liberibacter sp. TaxID=34022 RepID=UPI0015F7064F|nr:TadE/TadG family type IV pilus assembly protein [Candidatus Liberibacter sp.]MBA5723584.1 pilus assembly protein [Candidatus Liberibacter sp.]
MKRHRGVNRWIFRMIRCENGVAGIEMAIILPLLLIIYMGTYQITILYSTSKRMTRIASSIGDFVAQEVSINSTYLNNLKRFAESVMLPYKINDLSITVSGYWIDDKGVATRQWLLSSNSHPSAVSKSSPPPSTIADKNTFVVCSEVFMKHPVDFFMTTPSVMIPLKSVYYYRQRLGQKVVCIGRDCN